MYPPHHLGGYELVWRSAIEHLRRRGHLARVLTTDFCTSSTEPDDPETFRQLRWYWHDHSWPNFAWRERIALERHNRAVLRRHLDELQPDVVSWWAMGGMSLSLIEQVRRTRLPAVAFVHDEWLVYGPRVDQWTRVFRSRPRVGALAERIVGVPTHVDIDRSTCCLLVSETVRAHARSAGYALPDSTLAPSGIDTTLFRERPPEEWHWRLLYVGRIDERKGVRDAVAALAELPGETTLTIAGEGEPRERARVEELGRELNVASRLQLAGMRGRESLPDLYAAADAVLFPVRWEEPWGLVPLEAMAVGRPVVATGRGGSGEYLRDGDNCLLVPTGDAPAIGETVRRLAADPALRGRLREGGLRTAPRYTEDAFNQTVLDALIHAAPRRL